MIFLAVTSLHNLKNKKMAKGAGTPKVEKVKTLNAETPKVENEILGEQLQKESIDLQIANEAKQRKIEAGHLVEEDDDTDEIKFLKKIYTIQNDGCYGKHLNDLIKERIAEIKAK